MPEFYSKFTTGDFSGYQIKGVHLGKLKAAGSEFVLIVDGLNIKTSKRVLFYTDKNGMIGQIYDNEWYNNEEVVKEMEF